MFKSDACLRCLLTTTNMLFSNWQLKMTDIKGIPNSVVPHLVVKDSPFFNLSQSGLLSLTETIPGDFPPMMKIHGGLIQISRLADSKRFQVTPVGSQSLDYVHTQGEKHFF